MSTIHDVAKRAGVSSTTVSHVINKTRYVKPATRERVLQAMAELNYQPNRLARSLRSRRTHTLGVVLPNSANPFFAQILFGIEDACFDRGYNIILGNANDIPERELYYLDLLLSKQVDGILSISAGAYHEALRLLSQHDTPVVMVDRTPDTMAIDTVLTDNQHGGMLAAEHLIRLGHRRIGCITGPSRLSPSADRVTGYRQALTGANLTADDALIVSGDFQHESGYDACRQLLRLPNPPTAIFACNDMMAVGALCAVHEAGLRVPADISVIGFDDVPLAAYTVPRLTTIRQPSQEVGRVAVDLLIERLKTPELPARHERLPVSLVERESCGPLKE